MINKFKKSISFRSGDLYRWLCKHLPDPTYRPGPETKFKFVSMIGRTHLDMFNQCLISLNQSWHKKPDVILYSDGSIDLELIRKKFNWWKGSLQLKGHNEILNWTKKSEFIGLNTFAQKHPMGLKLGCILREAEDSCVLWCDSDILWYKELPEVIDYNSLSLKTSEDYQAAYDGVLSKDQEILNHKPYICAGLLLLNTSILQRSELRKFLDIIGEKPNHFTEQTFFAIASKLIGGETWPLSEIAIFETDRYNLKPSYVKQDWTARHYVGPVRHLFWKDSFFRRTGFIK